jgi:CheY-like chemotaxis protein
MTPKQVRTKNIFLADDDMDDCLLFEDALKEVHWETSLTMANDGQELMKKLSDQAFSRPDVIFLDLNIPRKNGFECLKEIKESQQLRAIPVVIFSTSSQPEAIHRVYEQGADYYICKPGSFALLIKAISKVLSINWEIENERPPIEKFLLSFT